ncbi:MAG: hypothetical protein PSN34_10820 [Urechidicola sp.]|nr:hypothetical protein [Urechidicola sp.]
MKIPGSQLFAKPLDNAADEITSKFKTPIFTTYIAIWVVRNNKFIYDLFFNTNVTDKTSILNNQFNFSDSTFYIQTIYTIGIALVVLIFYYFLTNLSRAITIFSEERVRLHILTELKSKTISSMEDVNYWRDKARDLEVKNTKLEDAASSLRSTTSFYQTQKETAEKKLSQVENSIIQVGKNLENSVIKHVYNSNFLSSEYSKHQLPLFKKEFENQIRILNDSFKPPTFIRA